MLNLPAMIMDLSLSLFNSANLCFKYFEALFLGTYIFRIPSGKAFPGAEGCRRRGARWLSRARWPRIPRSRTGFHSHADSVLPAGRPLTNTFLKESSFLFFFFFFKLNLFTLAFKRISLRIQCDPEEK